MVRLLAAGRIAWPARAGLLIARTVLPIARTILATHERRPYDSEVRQIRLKKFENREEKRDGLRGRLPRRGIEEIRSHRVMSRVRARGGSGLRCLRQGSSGEPWARGVELWGRAPGN
ncbi:hypothetical protein CDL15_Pgr021237 [Punica granatum]|uniref:Secreted protein n=1 Tax=Punica granatum TaxID=22663 RepID=A0A218WQI0_PUNGR|nr:hypothetical protein CDL15_Pgr021237 [Punica granatum]PKI68329.1 hypothetical protein CRG98_011237 [Punica granatum]